MPITSRELKAVIKILPTTHLHHGVLFTHKNNDFMKFTGKLMELENIILSEVTQSQMNTHGMYSLILGKNLGIATIQLTDHMNPKKKRRPKCDASV